MNELDRKLYELFADKTLSEGCLLTHPYNSRRYKEKIVGISYEEGEIGKIEVYSKPFTDEEGQITEWDKDEFFETDYVILGHEPHFEDILRVLFEKDIGVTLYQMHKSSIICEFLMEEDEMLRCVEIDYDWKLSPLSQSDETKSQLISLFS